MLKIAIASTNELIQLINNKEMLSFPEELTGWLSNLENCPKEVDLFMDCPVSYRLKREYANLEQMREVPAAAVLTLILRQEEEWRIRGSYHFRNSYLSYKSDAFFVIMTPEGVKKVVCLSHWEDPSWQLSVANHTDDEYEEYAHSRFFQPRS